MKTEQHYRKVEIKTEADLPKENGEYFCYVKGMNDGMDVFVWNNNPEYWLNTFDWYLQPIPSPELVSDLSDEGNISPMIITVEQRVEEIISNNPNSIHPSRLTDWQFRESIRFVAKQIDILHKLRIKK